MRIRMQVPIDYPPSQGPAVRAEFATSIPSVQTQQEHYTLEYLSEKGCSVTPKLLDGAQAVQSDRMPVPGGYLVYIVMEKVRRVSLENFWRYPRDKRDKIRDAFAKSLEEFISHRAYAIDSRPQNILYDENNHKCYFIDHESTYVRSAGEHAGGFSEEDYFMWGLARNDGETKYF